ncbi:hypothetical protein CUJ83_07580 [Methanocella sp. CWC-04]|uniref:Proteinase inhibitor I42 chagasin domain-containing protein n=1 Tax=Methanooceanicella nereidis TaxID=2052831 RepID=A0AAP2RES3_9EURY|nr:protease inhibitor I42 family protein [Methanocella sp. CWC-04]MCD1294857.1 hypothetical protein [Methanocella sp. CWC-04]
MIVGMSDNGRTVELYLRDRLEVRLPESQVSGYIWEFKEMENSCVNLIDSVYVERGASRFNALGERSWYFSPAMIGECELVFYLYRPWSKPSPEFKIKVKVK